MARFTSLTRGLGATRDKVPVGQLPPSAVIGRPGGTKSAKLPFLTPSQFGAVGDNVTDDHTALANLFTAANSSGLPVDLTGTYFSSTGLTADGIDIVGRPRSSTLTFPELGGGVAGLTLTDTAASTKPQIVDGVSVVGPGSYSLGVSPASCDGIKVNGSAKVRFNHCFAKGFHAGWVWNNAVGHITLQNCVSTNNLYGAYVLSNTGDFFVYDSELNGNTLAGIATPATVGISGLTIKRTHIGFQPFGVLMEAGLSGNTTNPFMSDSFLDQARFESIGNGVIVSLATFDGGDKVNTGGLFVSDPGYSFNNTYHSGSFTDAYLIDLGIVTGVVSIEQGLFPFAAGSAGQAGSSGVFRAQQAGAILAIRGDAAIPSAKITTVSGSQSVIQGTAALLQGSAALVASLQVQGASAAVLQLLNSSAEIDFNNTSARRITCDAAGPTVDTDAGFKVRDAANSYTTMFQVDTGSKIGFYGHSTVARSAAYTLNAGATSRNLASGGALANVEQVLRQLITDLQANGLMQ